MKWLERAGCITAFTLVSSGAAVAQSPVAAAPPDTTALAWAKRLLVTTHAQDALLMGFDSAFAGQRGGGAQQLPVVYFDSLMARGRRDAPQLIDSLAVIWAQQLSLGDLKEMVRFYESPLGQRYASAQVTVALQTGALAKRWGMRLALDVMKDLLEKGLMSDVMH
jgi:hypothetical protein